MSYNRIKNDPFVVIVEKATLEDCDEAKALALMLGHDGRFAAIEDWMAKFWPKRKSALNKSKLKFLKFVLAHPEGAVFQAASRLWEEISLWAISKGYINVIKAVGVNVPDSKAISCAVKMRSIKTVQLLVDLGDDPTPPGNPHNIPLSQAAENNDIEMVKLLIQSGSWVNQPDYYTWLPLDCALRVKNEEIIQILRSAGAKTRDELNGNLES